MPTVQPVLMVCRRDSSLCRLCVDSLFHSPHAPGLPVSPPLLVEGADDPGLTPEDRDYLTGRYGCTLSKRSGGYGNGWGEVGVTERFRITREVAAGCDWVWDLDCDVVVNDASRVLSELAGPWDHLGCLNDQWWDVPGVGRYRHMSGGCHLMRSSTVLLAPTGDEAVRLLRSMPGTPLVEDLALSIAMLVAGGRQRDLSPMTGGPWEEAVLGNGTAFVHLTLYGIERAFGRPVTGKRDIPKALREAGLYRWG